MEIKLYYDPSSVQPRPENEGLQDEGVERLLRRVREAGVAYSVVDVSDMGRDQLEDVYARQAVAPSVRQRYGIRRVFGTNKYPGAFFGKGVPALVVLEDGRPQDVYPHEGEGGGIVTIKDYVDKLAARGRAGGGRRLARRMDALRAKIGYVGASARELIDEGRRR
ncbi:MAG TPA: hypothetical protein VFT91_04780 [Dehalococcoidia bacterium]|nr:hypothetical protein [Dehalococcoidia bacterium]